MDSDERYKSNVAFIDLLFNVLIGFVFLFIIAFILINPIAKKGDIVVPAEFLIVMTWPDKMADDLDLWVADNSGHLVGFNKRDSGTMYLDRDDLGLMNDITTINGDVVTVNINREVISIRTKAPNEYRVSVHLYKKASPYDKKLIDQENVPVYSTIPVTVEVIKINPYKVIYKHTQILKTHGQIANFPSFTVTSTGDVTNIIDGTESIVPITTFIR